MASFFDLVLRILIRLTVTVYSVISFAMLLFEQLAQRVSGLTAYFISQVSQITGANLSFDLSPALDLLANVNALVPLEEVWAVFVFSVPVFIAVVIFRFVKQFIPTMSN